MAKKQTHRKPRVDWSKATPIEDLTDPVALWRGETTRVNFVTSRVQLAGLKDVERRDGINVSEQIRRAITAWLKERT